MNVGQYYVHPIRLKLHHPTNDICNSDPYLAETILGWPRRAWDEQDPAQCFLATTSMPAGTKMLLADTSQKGSYSWGLSNTVPLLYCVCDEYVEDFCNLSGLLSPRRLYEPTILLFYARILSFRTIGLPTLHHLGIH